MSLYFATSAKGVEPVTALELERIGAENVRASYGGVYFEGNQEVLYKANLWLRTTSRIYMPIKEFAAASPAMLYDQIRRIKWDQYLNQDKTFAVDCNISGQKSVRTRELREGAQARGVPRRSPVKPREPRSDDKRGEFAEKKGLTHSHFAALKIKDAIVDQLRAKYGARPNVDKEQPDLRINAYVNNGRCTLSLDASGNSLHERGYRVDGAHAPLKETLAAAIIELTEWNGKVPLIDPMCGSGTLVLEAALKALNVAPGLYRDHFGFMGWPDYDRPLWLKLVGQARDVLIHKPAAPIVGYDHDRTVIATALKNAERGELSRMVHFEKRELSELQPIGKEPGVLVTNPPYGERLGDETELQGLYKLLGDLFKQRMKGWNAFIFTGNLELAKHVGLRTSRRIELYNGPIECRLLKYQMY